MLDTLNRENEELKMSLLADICELCYWPLQLLSQEQLDEQCSACTISQNLDKLLEKQRTVIAGQMMQIVAEEMHPERKEKET